MFGCLEAKGKFRPSPRPEESNLASIFPYISRLVYFLWFIHSYMVICGYDQNHHQCFFSQNKSGINE